jgi:hypothetical protein
MPRIAIWLLAGGVLIGAIAALWIGGEMHYRSCLENADVRYPVAYEQGKPEGNPYSEPAVAGQFVYADESAREDATASCSRWP